MAADLNRINNTLGKMEYHLATHEHTEVSVSGGSDSNVIVHIIATNFRQYLPKIKFVFCNTGLEYRATLRHLDFMEQTYGIHIDRIRGMSVVTAVRRYGVPVLSKRFSQAVCRAQKGSESAIKLLHTKRTENRYGYTDTEMALCDRILVNKTPLVSSECCSKSKKEPLHKYDAENGIDLTITGERRCEGGIRALTHADCFEMGHGKRVDKYMPLFFWDDETKQYYKEKEHIRYSDCYEVWGFDRTGCVGCPFNSRVGDYLKIVKVYEPLLYEACINVFGDAYLLQDEFYPHRTRVFEDKIQTKLWEDEE